MSIIRRIIIKEWTINFLMSAFVLLMVLSLGNVLSNLLKANSSMGHILKSLSYEVPLFLVKIFPVSCLVASLFSLNKLKNRNELTAIFASGFSRRKFILTVATLGGTVGGILFYINSYTVPYSRHKAYTELKTHGESSVTINAINSGRVWFKGLDYFVSYSNFDTTSNTIHNLELYYFNKNFKIHEQVKAQSAKFLHDQTWLLSNFSQSTNLDNLTFPNIEMKKSTEWTINENIQDLKKINADISTLSIWKLYDYIKILKSNNLNANEYYVSFLDKFSSALTCLVLSLLSAVAIFNPNRRNSSFGLNVTFVLVFTFSYWLIYSYFLTLGQGSRISPIISTFGVPSLFITYLAGFFIYHRKLR